MVYQIGDRVEWIPTSSDECVATGTIRDGPLHVTWPRDMEVSASTSNKTRFFLIETDDPPDGKRGHAFIVPQYALRLIGWEYCKGDHRFDQAGPDPKGGLWLRRVGNG